MERKMYTSLIALVGIIFALLFVWQDVSQRRDAKGYLLSTTQAGTP